MNHRFRPAAALILALALAFSLTASAIATDPLAYTVSTDLGDGLTLTQLNSINNGVRRQQFTLDYTPGGAVQPLVFYGNAVYGRQDIQQMLAYAKSQGWHVLAAVNSDFFFTGSGVPTGMTIQNRRLVTSDGAWNAVGFFSDGSAIIGAPKLSISLTNQSGLTWPIYALNNVRTSAGIYLYTQDFDKTTRTTAAGTEVVLQTNGYDQLRLGQPLEAYVVSVSQRSNTPIGEGQLVLSLTTQNTPNYSLERLTPGERVTIMASTQDPAWHDVEWSTGGGNMLVRNGQITTDATGTSREPRTLLGVRADGSVVVVESDGRQASLGVGLTLPEAAQLMLDQGCRDVVNLDGGGSSILAASYPGYDPAVLSSPSDGKPRACATYLMFAATGSDQGRSYGTVVYPRSATVLAGGSVPVHAISYNENYLGFLEDSSRLTATDGEVVDGIFYAPDQAMDCLVTTRDDNCQDAQITVTDRMDTLRLTREGRTVTALALDREQTVDLDVQAFDSLREIYCDDAQFLFSTEGGIGQIDSQGVFTAGQATASGSITAAYGSYSVTIPVTVTGKAGGILEDFESAADWGVVGSGQASAQRITDLSKVRYGAAAMGLTYSGQEGDSAEYLFPQPPALDGATHLTLCARGTGNWNLLFQLSDGSVQTVPFTLEDSGWNGISVAAPAGAAYLLGFSCAGAGQWQVTLDQIMSHYGAAAPDTTPPQITVSSVEGTFAAVISDNGDQPLTAENIRLTIDGAAAAFNFQNGQLTAALPKDGARHRITLTAKDAAGNLARTSRDTGTLTCSFKDMKDHWAAVPVEYLLQKGIFSQDTKFNPETKVSNEMAATMLSRYLGVDAAQYENIALPYIDADNISDWALPHVKAMYALGIMQGSLDSQSRSVLYPQSSCTRSQIMTVLGRTLSRGYRYNACTFTDAGQIPDWARDHIDLLSSLGIITGSDTGAVNPNGSITRAEFAALLYRMY